MTSKILENDPNKVTLRRSYENFNNDLLKTNLDDVNFSFEQFLLELNNLLDIHAPFKYSNRKNEKHNKPWITNGIENSIRKKKNCIKNYAEKRTSQTR